MRMTDQRLNAYVAITVNGNIYMYSSKEAVSLVNTSRDPSLEWDGFADFMEKLSAREMAMLSVNHGIKITFTKGSKEDLAHELWEAMCYQADDRRTAKPVPKRDPLTGNKPRGRKPQNLGSRKYTVIEEGTDKKALLDDAPMTTRQAKKIYEFFVDEMIATGSPVITEDRMQHIVNDRAEELRTKQDPWRIFQYYRPELIQCKLIKMK